QHRTVALVLGLGGDVPLGVRAHTHRHRHCAVVVPQVRSAVVLQAVTDVRGVHRAATATCAPHLGRVGALLRVGRGVLRLGGGRRLFRGGRGLRLTRRRSAWTVFLQGRSLIGDEGLLARPRSTVQVHDPDLEVVGGVRGGDHVRVERLLPGWDALLEQDGLRRHTQAVLDRAIALSVGGARGSPPLHHVGRGVRSRREGQGRAEDQRGDSGPNGCALSHEVQPLGVFLRANRNSAANSTSRATSTPRSTTAWACSACAASTTPSAASTPMTAAPSAYSAARTPGRASTSRNFSIYLFSLSRASRTAFLASLLANPSIPA